MQVAQKYGKTPIEWFKEPRWSRAMMVAYVRDQNAMDWQQAEIDKKKK